MGLDGIVNPSNHSSVTGRNQSTDRRSMSVNGCEEEHPRPFHIILLCGKGLVGSQHFSCPPLLLLASK